jgi:hypothetical protein
MEKLNKTIKHNEKKINEVSGENKQLLIDLGKHLINKNKSVLNDKDFKQYSDLEVEIKTIKSEQDKINQFKKRIAVIDTEEKNIIKKFREIAGDNEKHFIGIGETVFSIYLERPGELFELEDYLKDMINLKDKIIELDDKIDDGTRNRDTGSFFSKTGSAVTGKVLESRKKLLESKYVTLYKASGKKLCDERFFEKTSDSEIKGIFSAYEGNLKVVDDFKIRQESLKAEKGNYQSEIEEKEKKLKSSVKGKTGEVIKQKTEVQNSILFEAGTAFYQIFLENSAEIPEEDKDLTELLKNISVKDNEKVSLAEETDRLKKEVEILSKQSEIDNIQETVLNKQEKLKTLKKEIDKLNRTSKKLEINIEELKQK